MKAILKERALSSLIEIPSLMDAHQQLDPKFIIKTIGWFSTTEEALKPLRSPIVSRLAALRGQLQASDEGLLHPLVSQEIRSARKRKNALAIVLLQSAESTLSEEVEKIEASFETLKDKLAQLIAIVSGKSPLPYSGHLTESYLDTVWSTLKAYPETQSMSYYIEAQTDLVDRRYLLQNLLANFTALTDRQEQPTPQQQSRPLESS